MNRKVLATSLALLLVAMLATPLFEIAQACTYKNIKQPYSTTYVVKPIQAANPPEIHGDFTIITGAINQGVYNGPLGVGTMTAELIRYVINTATGEGWQYVKNTLVITSGPYGAGTLVGYTWFKIDNVSPPVTTTSGGTFLCGNLGHNFITITGEKGYTQTPEGYNVWEEGLLIVK